MHPRKLARAAARRLAASEVLRSKAFPDRNPAWARRCRSAMALVCAAGATACSGVLAKGDGRAIGDDLGRFSIDAALETSTCGDGEIGGPSSVTFNVFLSEAPPHVYWNSGSDSVEGDLAEDGVHFDFRSETVVTLPGSESAADTCTVVRTDTSSGALDAPESARRLTGSLEYRFAIQGRSDCTAALAESGVSALPCTMRYRIDGHWVSAR
jgi:hypothetical protein